MYKNDNNLNTLSQPKGRQRIKESSSKISQNSKSKSIGNFLLGEKLGQGTFGVVRLATHILTGEKVAVKILEKVRILEEIDKSRVEREIKILKLLHHNNIIRLYSVIQTPTSIYLIMEYANNKELFDYINNKKRLSEPEACRFFQQIISGVEYLNHIGVAHRDLKPENLLLDSKNEIKIADFGLSNFYPLNNLLKTACGSPCYAAPEMVRGRPYKGSQVDIWSCGIVLYAMVCGYLPFEEKKNELLYKKIIEGKYTIPFFLSDYLKDLIKKILNVNPESRYTIEEIKQHPWFSIINPTLNMFEGLLINKIVIPIDEDIVKKMGDFKYDKEEIRADLLANRHNNITTTYYLLLKQKIRHGMASVSDVKSIDFIRYISDPKNLLESYDYDIEKIIKERAESPIKKVPKETPKYNSFVVSTISNENSISSVVNQSQDKVLNGKKEENKEMRKVIKTSLMKKKELTTLNIRRKLVSLTISTDKEKAKSFIRRKPSPVIEKKQNPKETLLSTTVKPTKRSKIKSILLTEPPKQKTQERKFRNFSRVLTSASKSNSKQKKKINVTKTVVAKAHNLSYALKKPIVTRHFQNRSELVSPIKEIRTKALSTLQTDEMRSDTMLPGTKFKKIPSNQGELMHLILNKIQKKINKNVKHYSISNSSNKFFDTSVSFDATFDKHKPGVPSVECKGTSAKGGSIEKRNPKEKEKIYLNKKAKNRVFTKKENYKPEYTSITASVDQLKSSYLPFDLSCIIFKEIQTLKEDVEKKLKSLKIKYRSSKGNKFTCEKNGIKFVLELAKLKEFEGSHILRFEKIEGNASDFRCIAKQLLSKVIPF